MAAKQMIRAARHRNWHEMKKLLSSGDPASLAQELRKNVSKLSFDYSERERSTANSDDGGNDYIEREDPYVLMLSSGS